jgi:acyl carrier protein
MDNRAQAQTILNECVARLNEQLPTELHILSSPEVILLGEGSKLDSLSLVNLLVDLEENFAKHLKWQVNLLDEALSAEAEPGFRSAGELVDWILARHARNT